MTGAELIMLERSRQQNEEGYDADWDDEYCDDELLKGAACYVGSASGAQPDKEDLLEVWPWNPESFKPTDRVRDLAKAGALIAAEIDRLQRKEAVQ